jgi:LmbE family N-acetylglucosaminyl deacetylase
MGIVEILTVLGVGVGILAGTVQIVEYYSKRRHEGAVLASRSRDAAATRTVAPSNVNSRAALFVLAHPDDAEIGCGGLIARLVEEEWSVRIVVVTDGSGTPETLPGLRRSEQIEGLKVLGIGEVNVTFLNELDGSVRPDRSLISKLRSINSDVGPEFVVTHSQHDNHQDHVNVNQAVSAAIRNAPILSCFIATSTRISDFCPMIYVSYLARVSKKAAALASHESQIRRGTFTIEQIIQSDRILSEYAGEILTEAFEVQLVPHSAVWPNVLSLINDAALPRFWNLASGGRKLAVIFPEAPANRFRLDIESSNNDFIAGTRLAMAIQTLPAYRDRVRIVRCVDPDVEVFKSTHCCVYIAGRIPNPEARRLYEEISPYLHYHFKRESLETRSWISCSTEEHHAEVDDSGVVVDYGLVTAVWGALPGHHPPSFVWVAGILGYGTHAAAECVVSPDTIRLVLDQLHPSAVGFQVIVKTTPRSERSNLLLDTLRPLTAERTE